MIIKKMDSKEEEIEQLSLLLEKDITPNQRFLIEREIKSMKSGIHGEENSAYYIDFYLGNSKNWAIIHDLRIEHENKVAQIDHILISRLFDMYILESKNYSYGIQISPEGEFQASYGKQIFGIPSPVEQNKRHIFLLDHFLKASEILPKRIGISIKPNFKNYILISPQAVITRPPGKKYDTSQIIKADALMTKIDEDFNKINPLTSIGKILSSATIEEVAQKLVSFHKPIKIDFKAKFGLYPKEAVSEKLKTETVSKAVLPDQDQTDTESSKFFCAKCRKQISEKVAKFCWQNKSKYGGKPYCFNCQKSF